MTEDLWPHRVDLKLPLAETLVESRMKEMQTWINEHRADVIGGIVIPYLGQGYSHMTMWFADADLAFLFRLTWSGQ